MVRSSSLGLRSAALVVVALVGACSAPSSEPEPVGAARSQLTAIDGLFPTGVDTKGTPLATGATDPHYSLSSSDLQYPGPSAIAVVPAGAWTGNSTSSKWISVQPSAQGETDGAYTYTMSFLLTTGRPELASLSGTWACDDTCILLLNGVQVARDVSPAWTSAKAFTIPRGSPFQLGFNTLAIVVTNTGGGPTGLQVLSIAGTTGDCNADNECLIADFCDTGVLVCVPKLLNGTPIPTIANHAPALAGGCSVDVGKAVCLSGVCDTSNNECGYANGDGPCSSGAECQSGACSMQDGNCGLLPGEPCAVDGECRSGSCISGRCPGPDAGTPPSDGGVTEPDGGSTQPDSGVTEPDGGSTQPDGGVTEPDGGSTQPDSGVTEPDGGLTQPDGGVTEPDGGSTQPDGGVTAPDGGSLDGGQPDGGQADAGIDGGTPPVDGGQPDSGALVDGGGPTDGGADGGEPDAGDGGAGKDAGTAPGSDGGLPCGGECPVAYCKHNACTNFVESGGGLICSWQPLARTAPANTLGLFGLALSAIAIARRRHRRSRSSLKIT